MTEVCSIYRLYNPERGPDIRFTRYVGITREKPNIRLIKHVYAAKVRAPCARNLWLSALRAKGIRPALAVVAKPPLEHAEEAERFWVAYFRMLGCHLLNATDGGDTVPILSPETRAKISLKLRGHKMPPRTPEHMARISAALKGQKRSAECRATMSAAKRNMTPEARASWLAKDAASHRGIKQSPETIAKRLATILSRKGEQS